MGNDTKSNCQCNDNNICSSECNNAGKSCDKHQQCAGANTYNISYMKYIKYKKKYIDLKKKGGAIFLNNQNNDLNNWKHKDAKSYYNDVVKLYGEPDIKVNLKNGICIWYNDDSNKLFPYSKIELKDESVEHCVPANHTDFLYSYVKVYIPSEKIMDVISVSGSVNYDPLKKELFARCGSFAANYATLRTVFDKINNINTNYPSNINNKDKELNSNKKYVEDYLKMNNKIYENEMKEPYHPLAFPKGCPNLKK